MSSNYGNSLVLHPSSPQITHEMIISFFLSVNNLLDKEKLKQTRMVISPSNPYIFCWNIMASSYKALSSNKNIKKVIVISQSRKVTKWFFLPKQNSIKTIFGYQQVSRELKNHLLQEKEFYEGDAKNSILEGIYPQLPFIHTFKKTKTILPIIIWNQKYIKLVNSLKLLIEKDPEIGIIFSMNFPESNKYHKSLEKSNSLCHMICNHNIRWISNVSLSNSNIAKSFTILSKKLNYKITPLLYSNSGDFSQYQSNFTGYFSIASCEK